MTSLTSIVEQESRFLLQIYRRYPVAIESGRGCYIFDTAGKRYLDVIAGVGVHALGYGHPRIQAVLLDQAQRSIHTSNLVYHPYQGPLAERLCAMSGLDRAFFTSSGTEAMETALKAVRARGRAIRAGKIGVVAVNRGFHGRTFGSLAVTGQPRYQEPFEPLSPGVTFVAPNDCAALERAVTGDTAGIVLEPVLGEGGILPLRDDFLRCAREAATRTDALLVADEIQCGLGRTGKYFAYQWAGIQPDVAVVAKPLAAGLPLGATLFTEAAAQALPYGSHGTTFGGGPLACRVALEFLAVLDEVMPQVAGTGDEFLRGLEWLQQRHPVITEVRGKGLMLGLQLSEPGRPFVERALERGLLINCTSETVLRLLPSYIISRQEVAQTIHVLDEVLSSRELGGRS